MLHLDDGMLNALLDRELSGQELREAEDHLHGCEECRARLEEYRTLMAEADQLVAAIEVPPAVTPHRLLARQPGWKRLWPVGLAAAALLAVGLGVFGPGPALWKRPTATAMNDSVTSPTQPEAIASAERADRGPARPAAPAGTPGPGVSGQLDQARIQASRAASDSLAARDRAADANQALAIRQRNAPAEGEARQAASPSEEPAARRDLAGEQPRSSAASGVGMASAAPRLAGESIGAAKALTGSPVLPAATRLRSRDEIAASAATARDTFHVVPMEDAVRRLGGSILLIDGLTPDHIELADAAGTGIALVRVVYVDGNGTRLVLDQRRSGQVLGIAEMRAAEGGANESPQMVTLSWADPGGFVVSLTGPVSADSLARLKVRVR